jgi:hypothetical protein
MSHWYDGEGNPCFTVIGANGKERATRVTDARKNNWYPSVTTVIGLLDRPMLTKWMKQNTAFAAELNPRYDGESDKEWFDRIDEITKNISQKNMQRGTDMHSVLEAYYKQVYLIEYPPYIRRTEEKLREHFGDQFWISEQRLIPAKVGYGGTPDLYSEDNIVVDFKTKVSLENVEIYPDHELQLAAYCNGLGMPNARCAIVFVSEDETKIIEIDHDKINKAWEMFQHLLVIYKIKNNLSQG